MPARAHVIWGDLETTFSNSNSSFLKDSSSTSFDQADISETREGKFRAHRLPLAVRSQLDYIHFNDLSSSQDSSKISSKAEPPPVAGALQPEGKDGGARAQGAADSAWREDKAQAQAASQTLQDDLNGISEEEQTPSLELWSTGSALHTEGKCKPCHYVYTISGCDNGKNCAFCHLPHTKKNRPRPCKTKRLQCKKIVSLLEDSYREKPEKFVEAVKAVSSQSSYLQVILRQRLRDIEGVDGEGAWEEEDVDLKATSSISGSPDDRKNIMSL